MTSSTEDFLTNDQLPDNMRVFELAKWLDVPAGELLRRVQIYDASAGTVLTSVDHAVVRNVLLDYRDETNGYRDETNGGNGAPDPVVIEQLLGALEESEHPVKNPVTAWEPSEVSWRGNDGFDLRIDEGQPSDGVLDGDQETRVEGEEDASPADESSSWTAEDYFRGKDETVDHYPWGISVPRGSGSVEADDEAPWENLERPPDQTGEEHRPQPGQSALTNGHLATEEPTDTVGRPEPAPMSFLEIGDRDEAVQSSSFADEDLAPMPDPAEQAGTQTDVAERDLADLELQSSGYAWLRDRVVGDPEPPKRLRDRGVGDPEPPKRLRDLVFGGAESSKRLRDLIVGGPDSESSAEETEAERASRARWHRVVVAVAIVLATTVLATSYSVLAPTYAAESNVVVTISGLGGEEIQREMQSLSVFAESQTVLAPVAQQFDVSVTEVRELFDSTIVGDSTVLRFTVTDEDSGLALAMNNAIVASYLEVANQPIDQDELEFVRTQITSTSEAISEIDTSLTQLEAQEAANNSLRLQIDTERNAALAQLSTLQNRLVDLETSGAAPTGSLDFVQTQVDVAQTRLTDLVARAQTLEERDAATRNTAERLRSERAVLRAELANLQSLETNYELEQISGTRVAVLAPGHIVDEPVGLTPTRAVALGLLVGGALAFAWVFFSTQLRRRT